MIARQWRLNDTVGLQAGTVQWCVPDGAAARQAREALQADGWTVAEVTAPQPLPAAAGVLNARVVAWDALADAGELARWCADPGVPCVVLAARHDLPAYVAAVRAGAACCVDFERAASELPDALATLLPCLGRSDWRVLVVDDDEASRILHAELLRRAGMQVRTLSAPARLFEALEAFDPDVLLLDLHMPDFDGVELAAALRQRPDAARLPVLFLSAEQDPERQRAALAAGADDFLVKLVDGAQLVATVQARALRCCRERQRARRLEALQRQRQHILQALDAHAIVSITDAAGRITYVNERFCAVSGYAREELLGANHRIVKSGAHPPAFYADLWATIRAGRIWQGEICNRRKDGRPYWVVSTIAPVPGVDGTPVQYVSIRTDVTPLKEALGALEVHKERLRRGQIYANIGTWDWNIQTGELYWSERIASLFGYPEGELETSYENFLKAVHPDDRQAVIDAVNACVERDVPYEIEHRVVWPDGTVRWLLERGAVQRDAQGRPLHMLGVVQDIHARKMAELALAERTRELLQAQELARLGNWSADLRTGELVWSAEIYRIFGYEPGSITPSIELFRAAVHPEDRALVLAREDEARTTGRYDVVHRIVRPDGTVRHVHELGQPELDEQGRLVRLVGTVQDVTDRVEAERRIHETEQRFAIAVEGAGDGVWDWDISSGRMEMSGHYEAMLGYARGELEPTIAQWRGSVHPDDLPRVARVLEDYLAGRREQYAVELRLRCKDGGYKWILCRGSVVERDAAGQPRRMIGIHVDISARKAVEEELVRAREEAERANQAKSEFLSSMSHELRTPMNAILGFAQLLRADPALPPEARADVDEILKAGQHLLELINEVLDLSRIEAGRVDLSLEPVELRALTAEAVTLVLPLAQARSITLEAVPAVEEVVVRADRTRLKQVILNLLSNAIKYNRPQGRVQLMLEPGRERVRLLVSDTGPGIAPERLGELFQPFNRLGAETTEIEGTGIGLVISRRLVEMMGGAIGVESVVGEGSTFWIELPRADAAAAAASWAERGMPAAPAAPADAAAPRHTVLYIEDNPANLRLMAQVLARRPGIALLTAHTASLGLELARTHRPDLILLDISMPGLNGYQVLAILREDAATRAIPVVALTANALPGDVQRGRAAGFDDYLTKPFDVPRLLQRIDELLQQRRPPQGGGSTA
ncbi:Virulence sensor protein BvgS [Tepidimonas sediminis]|uniref:histidine kinase n=1 Tax=Tepidimonas sediminis TaxID=2588941 RepID=A0A554WQN3_9BURK|nr:PAS domain-containing protein [Tepidimonas sediminis]TSE25875.1 Virulence sensor protein BvgS [Tepidimonas sediminis]